MTQQLLDGPTLPTGHGPPRTVSLPRWHHQFALLAAGGLLTVLGSLSLSRLVHGPLGEVIGLRLGLSIGTLQVTAACLASSVALLLALIGYSWLRQITASLRAHERNLAALRLSEARTAGILTAALDCIVSMDDTGKILEFNPAAERTFDLARAEVLGRDLADVLIPPSLREAYRAGLARYLATGQSTVLNQRIEIFAQRADSTTFLVELAVTPLCVDGRTTFTAYLRDLTEHKRTEEALRRQALAFANISDGVILTSLDGKIIDCNPAAERMFGYKKEELLGKAPSILHKPEQSGVLTTHLIECLRRDGRWAGEIQFRRNDGTEGVCDTVLVPLCDEQGKRLATLRVNRDVTEQKQAEQRQAAQHAVSRALAEANTIAEAVPGVLQAVGEHLKWPVGVFWEVDRSRYLLRCSHFWHAPNLPISEFRAACQQTTLGPGIGLAGRVWCDGDVGWAIDLAQEDNVNHMSRAVQAGLRGAYAVPVGAGEDLYGVLTFYTWQGRPPHNDLLRTLTAIGTQFGHFVERRRADEALKMQVAVLENMAEGVLVADEDGRIFLTNPALDALFGYERGQLVGQSVGVLTRQSPEENARTLAAILKELRTRGTWFGEFSNRKCDETSILTSARMSALELGGKTYLVSVQEDVTERKRAEEELQRAKEAAAAANRLKSEFLANMSHEIRTPLNGIIGMTELALDTELTREQWEYLHLAKTSAEALLEVINDILDFSKIEAGKLDLDPVEFRLRNALAETVKPLGLRAHKKNLELACHVAPTVPDTLVGDPGRLRQVLVNLVGNGIKFTEQGEVVVHADVKSQAGDAVTLHFTVRDTGIGVPQEKHHLIFDAFAQADGSTTRKYGGTGLGLAIASQLVRIMGGQIWVESEPGAGSTFHFTARFGLPADPLTRTMPRNVLKLLDLPVLVVDDNGTSRHILEKMLAGYRMATTVAEDGPAALRLLEQGQARGTIYSLALIDAQMPGMDGFAVAERIRQQPGLVRSMVMLLTADDLAANIARCEQLGIGAYVTKPVKQSELLEAMQMALSLSLCDHRPSRAPEPIQGRQQGLQILLVEDNPVNQRLAMRLLEKRGHKVQVACNGKEALEQLAGRQFNVVLMDVQMPEMGGFEATGLIRSKESEGTCFAVRGGRLPIIAMTAHAMKGDRERCLEAGMDGYVSKPIEPEAMWAAIREAVPDAPAPVPIPMAASAPDDVVIDPKALLARMDGDTELLHELVGLFLDDCPKLLGELRDALAAADAVGVRRAAHTFKGAFGNLSAVRAQAAAQRLETLAKEGDLASAGLALGELEKALGRLRPALAALAPEAACS